MRDSLQSNFRTSAVSFILAFLIFFFTPACLADTVILKSGKTYQGKIVDITQKALTLDQDGIVVTLYMDEVDRFEKTKEILPDPSAEQKITYRIRKTFLVRPRIELLTLQFTFPLSRIDIPGQAIEHIITEPAASALIDRPDGNKVAIFHFSEIKSGEERKVVITYDVTLDPVAIREAPAKDAFIPALSESQLKFYLSVDKSWKDRKDLNEAVQMITQGKTSIKDKARAVYDYIADHFSYQNAKGVSGAQPPYMTLFNKTGNCVDVSQLYITLARLSGVPARQVLGIVFQPQDNSRKYTADAGHAWAEVYLPEVGWAPVDAIFGIGLKDKFFSFSYRIHVRESYEENISQGPGSLYRGSSMEASSVTPFSPGVMEQSASFDMELTSPSLPE